MAGYIGSKSSVTQVDGYSEAEADAEFVNDPNGAITVDGGNVGINDTAPSSLLQLTQTSDDATGGLQIRNTADSNSIFIYQDGNVTTYDAGSSGEQAFKTGNAERIRIDSSGGTRGGGSTTDYRGSSNTTDGAWSLGANGNVVGAVYQDTAMIANRMGNDGDVITVRKNGSTVGTISCFGGELQISTTGYSGLHFGGTKLQPMYNGSLVDNTIDLGHPDRRFDDVYASNGTIQTSDFNEKQDIASLTATEMLVGKRISALFKTFRWKDSVAEKGDNARTHTGVIAQDVQAAFTAEGLDAGDYSLFISTTWFVDAEGNEVEEGTEGAVSKTRMGIRYPELLCFVGAYNEQRFASIEARLTALEA